MCQVLREGKGQAFSSTRVNDGFAAVGSESLYAASVEHKSQMSGPTDTKASPGLVSRKRQSLSQYV